jgi:His/Glu/Gln/Arg/opine family amino acid ABC transporter permease subunit
MDAILENLDQFASGLALTVEVTILALALGFVLALPVALLRESRRAVLWMPAYAYTFYFRGTPLLVQLFLCYYGAGQFRDALEAAGLWVWFREPYFCALLTLTLNTAAYSAEVFRGAIRAVPRGEVEAARASGMSGVLLYRRIVLPKAARLALPGYSNEVVFLLQATSLVSIITLMDLTGVARVLIARTFLVYEIFLFVGALYLVLTYGVLWLFRRAEWRLSGHLRPPPSAAPHAPGQAGT